MQLESIDRSSVKKILITVSDDYRQIERAKERLKALFPEASVSTIIKPDQVGLAGNGEADNTFLHAGRSLRNLLPLFWKLKRERFDLIVIINYTENPGEDLRYTRVFAYFLRPRYVSTYTDKIGFELIAAGKRRVSPLGRFLKRLLRIAVPRIWVFNIFIVLFFVALILPFLLLLEKVKKLFLQRRENSCETFPLEHLSNKQGEGDEPVVASVVIRTKNEGDNVERTLASVFAQDFPDGFEVIIVDSGSVDNTAEVVKDYKVRCAFIKPEDFTYGYSLNVGAKMSRGKYIANLSQHSPSLHNRWLANLVRNFDNPEVAAVYGKQVAEPFSDMIEARYLKAEFGNERKIRTNNFHFSNANCAISKRAWEEEPFDETLTGSEDREWAKRILTKGYKIVYEPDAPVYHSHRRTFLQKYHYARINLLAEMRFFDKRDIQSMGELFKQWKWLCIGDQLWVLANPGHLRWLLFAPIVRFLEAFVYFYFLKWKK